MKKRLLGACIQAVVIGFVIGCICFLVRGDFLYRYLAPIFGFLAGLAYFVTGTAIEILHEIRQTEKEE
ncbi:hypothetical protein [Streptococcus sp. NLN64]|uniref:hypothetical protein n=1 Tax=Streptococcus sp. NLN64 TaxID=2822799 RepID=UPI0018CB31B1|nr:hypothetical protein [Streptococcus sp. NLN64]MBG9367142.1 hypothetical protein [Streptococcus sp. NLN64]